MVGAQPEVKVYPAASNGSNKLLRRLERSSLCSAPAQAERKRFFTHRLPYGSQHVFFFRHIRAKRAPGRHAAVLKRVYILMIRMRMGRDTIRQVDQPQTESQLLRVDIHSERSIS